MQIRNHNMATPVEENLLKVCMSRCAGLNSDTKSVPQLDNLHRQVKALRSSLRKMNKALRPHDFDSFDSDPTKHPGLSLLAAYLFNLRNVCGYFGLNDKTTWNLSSEQRNSALNMENNPFERLAEKLFCIVGQLKVILRNKHTDIQERAENLCEWAESMIEHWGFFKGEFGAARGLAVAASATGEFRHSNPSTTISDKYGNPRHCQRARYYEFQGTRVWDRIRYELAAEGIGDDAVSKVADDLKACVRDLVARQNPEDAPSESESTDQTVNTNESTASEEIIAFRGSSRTLLDRESISPKVTAALDRISTDFHQVANEVLAIALQESLDDDDTKTFREVLDVIYLTACRDTTRANALARLAKHIQANTTSHIQRLMTSKKWAKIKAEGGDSTNAPGPVTSWYLGRSKMFWTGRNGKNKLSAVDLAFGLPRFIGELLTTGVFKEFHVHIYIRDKWSPTMERDDFVAIYQLLRTTGRMCEGRQMRASFRNIARLIEDEDTPSCVKALAQELQNLRQSKWKSKESKVIDQVEEEMRKET